MRILILAAAIMASVNVALAQQPSQVHLYCMHGQAELRLTRQSEGRSVCLIRSFGHNSTAEDWAKRNLPEGRRCSCG